MSNGESLTTLVEASDEAMVDDDYGRCCEVCNRPRSVEEKRCGS